jgi:hypothetical protein
MSRRTIENCRVIKSAKREGIGKPLIEKIGDKNICQGYQKSNCDDEPCEKCINCHLNIYNFNER